MRTTAFVENEDFSAASAALPMTFSKTRSMPIVLLVLFGCEGGVANRRPSPFAGASDASVGAAVVVVAAVEGWTIGDGGGRWPTLGRGMT